MNLNKIRGPKVIRDHNEINFKLNILNFEMTMGRSSKWKYNKADYHTMDINTTYVCQL